MELFCTMYCTVLTIECRVILHAFYRLLFFFQNQPFPKILSGIPSECHRDWTLIRPDNVGPDLGSNCLLRLSADGTSIQRVNTTVICMI